MKPVVTQRCFLPQKGTTLVEVMLAIALGLFLMIALIQIYITCKTTFDLQQAIMELQENGRFAIHFLNQNIRMAGYAGCNNALPFVNQDLALQGYDANIPAVLQGKVVPGTDSLLVGLCRKENNQENFNQYAFFISNTSRKNALGKAILALYEMPIDGSKSELVADIEQMQISYGVKASNGNGIAFYASAEQIKNWQTVGAVEIFLLLTSEEPVFTKAKSYKFMDEVITDRYLHQEWHTYIALRERL